MKRQSYLALTVLLVSGCGENRRAVDTIKTKQPGEATVGLSCGPVSTPSASDTTACSLVVAEVRNREGKYVGRPATFDPVSRPLRREVSAAIPRLVYWSALYAPPGTADMFVEVVAAHMGKAARLIESPADWYAVVNGAGWRPSSTDESLAACSEAVSVGGPRGSRTWVPFLYTDSASLQGTDSVTGLPPFIADDLRKTGRLRVPHVRADGLGSWQADFWMIEARQTTRYRCRIGPTRLDLSPTDSIENLGIFTPGP